MRAEETARVLSTAVLLGVMIVFAGTYQQTRQEALVPNREDLPEQHAAEYLAAHLQTGEKVLSISPVDIQTAYYLFLYGIPYDAFYQRDHPEPLQNAIVVLRTNSKYNSPQAVLDFFKITENFDLSDARLLYEYGPIQILRVPAK